VTATVNSSFAWPNTGIICGVCHHQMDCSVSKNTVPAEFRATHSNPECPNRGKLYRVGREMAVTLYEVCEDSTDAR